MIVSDMVKDSPKLAKLVDESEEMYYSLLAGEMTLESILTSDTMTTIKLELDQMKTKLHNRSKTGISPPADGHGMIFGQIFLSSYAPQHLHHKRLPKCFEVLYPP